MSCIMVWTELKVMTVNNADICTESSCAISAETLALGEFVQPIHHYSKNIAGINGVSHTIRKYNYYYTFNCIRGCNYVCSGISFLEYECQCIVNIMYTSHWSISLYGGGWYTTHISYSSFVSYCTSNNE